MEFCSDYLSSTESIGLPKSRHEKRQYGQGTRGVLVKSMNYDELQEAHLYILNNIDEVKDYISSHKELLKAKNYRMRMTEQKLLKEHNRTFVNWFKQKILNESGVSETVKWLAGGPNFDVICWSAYDINGYSFYTKSLDEKSTVQNSGVMIMAEAVHFSSSKDMKPKLASRTYFGVIEEIWEVDYTKFRVPVFKCK